MRWKEIKKEIKNSMMMIIHSSGSTQLWSHNKLLQLLSADNFCDIIKGRFTAPQRLTMTAILIPVESMTERFKKKKKN